MNDLEMYRGDYKQYQGTVTVTVDDVVQRADLSTAADVRFTAKRSYTDDDTKKIFAKTIGSGITLLDQNDDDTKGQFLVEILHDDTKDLKREETLVWDVQVTDPAGKPHTVLRGTLRVRLDVSVTVV